MKDPPEPCQQLTHVDESKRFAIELFTGRSPEHWMATNAVLRATSAPAARDAMVATCASEISC